MESLMSKDRRSGFGQVLDMIENLLLNKAPSRIAALGRYVITPEIFKILEQTKPGKGGEIQLTDALRVMAKNGNVYAYNFKENATTQVIS